MAFDVSFVYRIVDRYSDKLDKIQRKTSRFNTGIRKAGTLAGQAIAKGARGFNAMGAKLRSIGTLANSAAAGMATLALSIPVNKAIAFETAVTDLDKAFTFGSLGERSAFIDNIKKLGPELGFTATRMSELAFEAGKLGIGAKDAGKFIELAAKASTALDGLPIEEAGQIVGDLKNKFRLGAEGVELLLDSVNTLADNTTANGGQILNVLSRMSSQFDALEFPPELAAGFSAFARQVSVSDELAASGLKQFTQKLVEMGLQAKLQADPLGTIQGVLAKIQNMAKGDQGSAIIDMFGLEAAPFVTAMVTKTDLLAKTLANVGDKANFAGSMQSEFNRKQQTTAFRIDQVKAKFDLLLVTVGEKLLPTFNRLLVAAQPILDKLVKFADENPRLVKMAVIFGLIAAAIIPIGVAIGAAMFGITALGTVIGGIFAAISGVATALSVPVLAVVAAIGLAVAGVVLFWDKFKALGAWLMDVFAPIFDTIGAGVEKIQGVVSKGLEFFGIGQEDPTISQAPAGQSGVDVAAQGAAVQRARIDGQIGIAVQGPGKVTESKMQSTAPGSLGMNVGMAAK